MDADQLVSSIKKLSPTPKILPELRRLLKDSDSSMHDIVNLIKVDNALSSQLIRVSNTPFYGAVTPNTNVEEAINRIGFHEVYKLIAFLVCNGVMNSRNTLYNLDADELWKDSISCSLMMQVLAKFLKQDTDNAYTIGLMHSIGKTAISTYYQETRKPPPNFGDGIIPVEKEYKILGFSHAEAGASLLGKWKFGKETTEPINNQFTPEKAGEFEKAAYTLYVAKKLFPHLELEAQQVIDEAKLEPEAIEALGIYDDDLLEAVIDTKAIIDEMSSVLNMA